MHERSDYTNLSPHAVKDAAQVAARSAVSADALAAHVVELEAMLRAERSLNAGRVREIDVAMRTLRKSLQDLQEEAKSGAAERERLREQLEQSRRNLAALADGAPGSGTGPSGTAPSGPSGDASAAAAAIDALETEVADAHAAIDAACLERDDLRSRIELLQAEVARRDERLTEAAQRVAACESRIAELDRALRAALSLHATGSLAVTGARPAPGAATPVSATPAKSTGEMAQAAANRHDPIFDTSDPPSVEALARGAAVHDDPPAVRSSTNRSTAAQKPSDPAAPQGVASVGHSRGAEMLDDSGTGPGELSPTPAPASSSSSAPSSSAKSSAPPRPLAPVSGGPPAVNRHAPVVEASLDPSFPEIPGHRVERLIDDGPLGKVYEAREIATRRPVIVRVLPCVLKLLDGKRLDSLLLSKHANLVTVLSFAVCRAGPYLVMERAEGEASSMWVRRVGPLPERVGLAVALECARGLRQAAFHGALHLDLSPDAVLVDATGNVRVRGVGLRPVLSPQDNTPQAPEFAATERLRGSSVDVRSDIYSLGAVLHFLLTGKPPFEGSADHVARQQAVGAPSVREVRSEISAETAKLLQRMMSMDPDRRHATWDQVLVDLERRVPGQASPELRGNLRSRVRRFAVLHPWVVPASIAALLAAAVITRIAVASDESGADRFRITKVRVQALVSKGDTEGARELLRPYLRDVGDLAVEREAASLFDELRKPLR